MKKLRVTVDGKSYDVVVEILDAGVDAAPVASTTSVTSPLYSDVPLATSASGSAANSSPTPGGAGEVASPLAGKVVSVDVKLNQPVEEGAQVATIEAMKMNTYLFAPKSGRVTAVLVNPGEGVEEGAVLLQIA